MAAMHIQAAAQARVVGNRAEPAGSKGKAIRKRRIVQRMTRCKWHCAGHIRDAIMDYPALDESRGGMRRRMRAFETAALINRDIDENGALLHAAQHLLSDELRRGGARDKHRANHRIGGHHRVLLLLPGGDHTLFKALVDLARGKGAELIAEQIETEADARFCAQSGARFGQGWLFGKASPEALRQRDKAKPIEVAWSGGQVLR